MNGLRQRGVDVLTVTDADLLSASDIEKIIQFLAETSASSVE